MQVVDIKAGIRLIYAIIKIWIQSDKWVCLGQFQNCVFCLELNSILPDNLHTQFTHT